MDIDRQRSPSLRQLRDAAITIAAVLLAFAAFDDITTDKDTSFTAEYSGLILCGAWLAVLAVRLLRGRQLVLGSVSLLALAGAIWGQGAIGPGTVPSTDLHYLATVGAFAWFAALSSGLLLQGWRPHPEVQAQPRRC